MVDAQTVLLFKMLEGLGVTSRTMTLFEFNQIDNVRLLEKTGFAKEVLAVDPRSSSNLSSTSTVSHESSAMKSIVFRYERPKDLGRLHACMKALFNICQWPCSFKAALNTEAPYVPTFGGTLCGNSKFVSGQVFSPVAMGSMLANACYTPGIMEVVQALVAPNEDGDVFIWQIHACPDTMVGRSFAKCWLDLLHNNLEDTPALALGLYRFMRDEQGMEDLDHPSGYVVLNPDHEDIVRETDLIYVLASQAWGAHMCDEGLLVQAESKDRAQTTVEVHRENSRHTPREAPQAQQSQPRRSSIRFAAMNSYSSLEYVAGDIDSDLVQPTTNGTTGGWSEAEI